MGLCLFYFILLVKRVRLKAAYQHQILNGYVSIQASCCVISLSAGCSPCPIVCPKRLAQSRKLSGHVYITTSDSYTVTLT